MLWHEASVYKVSAEGLLCSVASYDKLEILRTYYNLGPIELYIEHDNV